MISLGVDVGTTHTKVLALDIESGTTVGLATARTPLRRDDAGEAHRPADILVTVVDLIREVVADLDAPHAVRALSVASVGEEVVLLDERRRPVSDAIAWYDPRGQAEAAAFMAGDGAALQLSRRWPPDPTFSLFKLMWTRDQQSDDYAAARSWTDLGDSILAGLGGDIVMDWTHASRAGAFDVEARSWDSDSIEAAGVDIEFPRLVASGTAIGRLSPELARHTGLQPDVELVSGGHDHLCAAYGAGLRSTSELFLSAGTSEAHLALLERPEVAQHGRYRIDQGCYVDETSYYAHINVHSGHFFKQWRALLYADADDGEMYAEVEGARADSVVFELDDDLRLGRLDGVPYGADRAMLMYAVLEGLAARSADIVDHLEVASGRAYDLILAAGHPTRVPLWKSLRISRYRRPMAAVEEPEPTAFGAAVMAARAVAGQGAAQLVARTATWS